jgi:hypothetical protein
MNQETLSTHLLCSMADAVSNIQDLATANGFERDISNASEVMRYLADTALDLEDYAQLFADSRTINDSMTLLDLFCDEAAQAKGRKLAAFDYNA